MSKRGVRVILLFVGVSLSLTLFPVSVFGATVYTRLIDMTFMDMGGEPWYEYTGGDPAGHIDFEDDGTPDSIAFANLYIQGSENIFANVYGTFEFASDLKRDDSGSLAKGYFEGGVTVKIIGGLRQGATWIYGGLGGDAEQILEATLKPLYEDPLYPNEDRWEFIEMLNEEGNFDRTLVLDMVEFSIGLASGIGLGGGDLLMMTGPKMDLSLKTASADDFVTESFTHSGFSNVKITGTPEPMTIILLGLGALFIRKKR